MQNTEEPSMEKDDKPLMIVGIDDSDHSFYALEWTLDHFFSLSASNPPNYKLMIVHAKLLPSAAIGLVGAGAAVVVSNEELDLKKSATRVVENTKALCESKSVKDITVEVVEGDPRNVICGAVDKYHATILVLGNHGYGIIKRAVLGSVSDFCAHHVDCSVIIVKKPKTHH